MLLYQSYTYFVTAMLYSLFSFQCIELFGAVGRVKDLVESIYTLGTIGNSCWKVFNLTTKRKEIIEVFELLESDICQPQNIEEEEIEKRSNKRIR